MGFKLSLSEKQKLQNMRSSIVTKKEAVSIRNNIEEIALPVFQKLVSEEANLLEEKKNLASLRKKLLSKVREEIDTKKTNIHKLRAEIKDLKFSCEEMSKSFRQARRMYV